MPHLLFATITTPDYLPRALALRDSIRAAYGEGAEFVLFYLGETALLPAVGELGLDVLGHEDLALPAFWDMAFRYEKGALANALKPFVLAKLLRERRPRHLVFLDADTLVYAPLEEAHALLEDGASIVLTPHHDRPQARTREPHEIDLLRHGVMNGGFAALGPGAEAFLAWWGNHLLTGCRYEPERGYYGDQHWLDLVPALFDGVRILRHRGHNAAYWNDPDRAPHRVGDGWRVDDVPLRFYHFSQWRLERGESVEEAVIRLYEGRADPDLAALLADYGARCRRAADLLPSELRDAAYPFAHFLDGTPVPRAARDAYARAAPISAAPTREAMFGRGLAPVMARSPDVPAFGRIAMPALYVHLWRSRPDLHRYDLLTREGQCAFLEWVLAHAAADHDLPDAALEPARRALASHGERRRRIAAMRSGLARAYNAAQERARSPGGGGGDLIARAEAAVRELAGAAGQEAALAAGGITDAPRLFGAIGALRPGVVARHPGAGLDALFEEIDRHGAYLAGKLGLGYPGFVRRGDRPAQPPADAALVRADAVRNAASLVIDLLDRCEGLDGAGEPSPAPSRAA